VAVDVLVVDNLLNEETPLSLALIYRLFEAMSMKLEKTTGSFLDYVLIFNLFISADYGLV
jgi:hypothetical protein